ncbi:DNA double-strand break repair nuclease NurA [Staphylospora marina]|uniref:DNA double-strand break repair nuclease NurA n=1 Tax=Staphylospora marina TaxID=2490858 RepID=UPI001F14A951|nr:DNA double-strand break repair nuclease NurA [Staphylospora marina]
MSKELKDKLEKLNRELRSAFPKEALDETDIRRKLERIGRFVRVDKWNPAQMKEWLGTRSLVGVDGSVNSTKGSPSRSLSVFQALAKSTDGKEKWAADLHVPFLEEAEENVGQAAREARQRGAILSRLELQVAEEGILDWNPRVVMMDGSLLHFSKDDADGWNRLAALAERTGTLLVGVSEEIATRSLVRELFPELPAWSDRDLLYGILRVGEGFEWEEWSPDGGRLWKMVFRSSKSPQPIGLDGLQAQREERLSLVRLVYSLTPEQGRGIPFWLDIVDNQVRVTDPLVESMVEEFIDPDIRHRVLRAKRSDRMI